MADKQPGDVGERGEARGSAAAAAGRQRPEKSHYAVYEALTREGDPLEARPKGAPQYLQHVANVEATDPDTARWDAVEGNNDLRKRVVEDNGAAFLLTIPLARATPKETKEEVEVKKVRK